MGRWRMEVSPGAARAEDVFLHLIQVGDQSLTAMTDAQLTTDANTETIMFAAGARTITIQFQKTGAVAGHIRIEEGTQTVLDQAL